MSLLREEMLGMIAQTIIGAPDSDSSSGAKFPLSPFALKSLTSEVEFRLREVLQQASKFASHSKRPTLSCKDINDALKSRNLDILYGFEGTTPLRSKDMSLSPASSSPVFTKAAPGLFFQHDPTLELADLMHLTIPKVPYAPSFNMHWLAIAGIQPKIPENEPMTSTPASSSTAPLSSGSSSTPHATSTASSPLERVVQQHEGATIKPLVKHILSEEMITFYTQLTDAIRSCDNVALQLAAYDALRSDPGVQQLLPYLCVFLYDEVVAHPSHLVFLSGIVQSIGCLLANPALKMELYLHYVLPVLLTCVLGKTLCHTPAVDNHWALRDTAARLVARLCDRYGRQYSNLTPRVAKTYHTSLNATSLPLTSLYGALTGIEAMGPHAMEALLFPRLPVLVSGLEVQGHESRRSSNPVQQLEAQYCLGALIYASGRYLQNNDVSTERRVLLMDAFGEYLVPYLNPVRFHQSPMLDTIHL